MFVPISNSPRDYAWGKVDAISHLLGLPPTHGPEAELWLGAHPASPAQIIAPEMVDGALNLHELVRKDSRRELPYLLKVLAASAPLSLQVHPDKATAVRRFREENTSGVPVDDPRRLYRDENHKPEMIVALEDGFRALCGVRPADERRAIVAELQLDLEVEAIDELVRELLKGRAGAEITNLVSRVVEACRKAPESSLYAPSYRAVVELNDSYPGDPGVVIALFLNLVELKTGEALYLPAGNLHAYLEGLGVEIMANSDNVLRGGLTPKHVDVDELLKVTQFEALPLPRVLPSCEGAATYYRTSAQEFELVFVSGDAEVSLTGEAIALVVSGGFDVEGEFSAAPLGRGDAVLVTEDEISLHIEGEGLLVLAQPREKQGN